MIVMFNRTCISCFSFTILNEIKEEKPSLYSFLEARYQNLSHSSISVTRQLLYAICVNKMKIHPLLIVLFTVIRDEYS